MSATTTRPISRQDHPHDVRNAWLCLLLLPVATVGAFVVGEWLFSVLGDGAVDGRPPLWVVVAAAGPALVLNAVPAALASWFAHRAGRRGDARGWLPAGLLIAAMVGVVALNGAAYLLG
jgi:hypothetical protein